MGIFAIKISDNWQYTLFSKDRDMKIGEFEFQTIDIVTFLGMTITLFTSILNLFQNRKNMYINNITRYRVAWINTLRTHVANLNELSNLTNLYVSTKGGMNKVKYRRELDKVVSLIKMHLNFSGELDRNFMVKVEELKSILNSYLLMFFYKNTIQSIDDEKKLVIKFNEVIDVISERKVLEKFLEIGIDNKNIINTKSVSLLDLKKKIKSLYLVDNTLIRKLTENIEYIIQDYENEIEKINKEIDEIIQIYLKAEWIRCKMETKMWPFNIYNEEKTIKQLQKKYKSIIKSN